MSSHKLDTKASLSEGLGTTCIGSGHVKVLHRGCIQGQSIVIFLYILSLILASMSPTVKKVWKVR